MVCAVIMFVSNGSLSLRLYSDVLGIDVVAGS